MPHKLSASSSWQSSLSLLLAACGGSSEPTKGDLNVYVAAPLSGFQANGGQTVLGGARLAAEEFNRSGGLLGYKVVIVPLDDESDSDVAVSLAEQVKSDLSSGQARAGSDRPLQQRPDHRGDGDLQRPAAGDHDADVQ